MLLPKPYRSAAKAFFALLLSALIFAQQTGSAQQPAQALKARPLPPVQYIPNRDYDMRHIALNLSFDWEREQALGTATISFSPLTSSLRQVEFDAGNMTFTSVRLAAGGALQYETDVANEKLRIRLDKAYQPADTVTVVMAYHTNGSTEKSAAGQGGLTFIKPTPEDPSRPRQIWSQGQSEWNHHWFPCFDHPNDFATSEMIATVEKPLTAISNGKLVEKKTNSDNTQTFHWKMDKPHASYLTSIVVGEFATVEQSYDGIPIISYVYANQVEEGKVTVARVPQMMKFFQERTGVKYPNARYGQAFVYGFGGGMENITVTTLSDQTIHDARTELDRTQDGLLSHELAHSWFGNYVTPRTWSELWLSEGFATYCEGLWTEHHSGLDEFLYLEVKGNQEGYYNAWRQGVRRPIVTRNYREPDAVFDAYSYPRSGAVMHMLRKVLGEENWWRAVNHFLKKHAHQPVETEQFRIAIEEATGQPLEWFFDQWVYKMGHPIFRVTQAYDPAKKALTLKVRQEQKIDAENAYPQARFFQTPVEIEINTAQAKRLERVEIKPLEEQLFTFELDSEPLLVNFDYGNTLIKELSFVKPVTELIYQLKHDADVMGRVWAIGQLRERVRESATAEAEKQQIAQGLGAAATGDKFWGVRKDAVEALSGIAGNETRAALLAATKDKEARVRAAAVESLAVSNDSSLENVYRQMLSDKSYATIRAAASALGKTKTKEAYDALLKLASVSSWRDTIRAAALNGLASLGDPRALEMGVRYAAKTNPREVRLAAYALLGAVGKNDPRAFPIISEAFTQAVSSGSTSLTTATARSLVELGDERGLQVFEEARKNAKRPEFQFLINQFEQQLRQKSVRLKTGGSAP
ncbi:MAG: HEAT repeat domain-containing protein [Pyrinomonadaceae bacterium]|nr:HEAT repeat domain-containing protein [Pyrinomonadaceae bacterium]